jgi:hypothetical protein
MNELQTAIYKLAKARQMTEMAEDEVRWTKKEISETELGVKLAEEEEIVRLSKADEAAARTALDELVLAQFDGNKHPVPAITIKDYTVYGYDPKVAAPWALENMRGALVLDNKRFERLIAAGDVPDFVTVTVEHRVTVASDLSSYLA